MTSTGLNRAKRQEAEEKKKRFYKFKKILITK